MAKLIAFGEAVNDAERWAFKLLAEELPADYTLLTNIEIPTPSGQALEVDALVVGEWGIYVVDVKGYIGCLEAGQHAWALDGRDVDNSLAKANYVARVLAGKIKHKVPVGVYAPWCQGMVFVTGRKGSEIELEKTDGALSIYTPKQIIAALTKEWGLTAPRKYPVSAKQKQMVLDTLGQVALVEQRNNRIQDFEKKKCLFLQHGLEVWQAQYSPGDWSAPWLLKIIVPSSFDDKASQKHHENLLRKEFYRLQTLAGCSGVPYCAPLIQDGERLVLPVRMPKGQAIAALDIADMPANELLEILRCGVSSLQQIHRRGMTVAGWDANCVFVAEDGAVEFIDVKDSLSFAEDITAFAALFYPIAKAVLEPRIRQWFKQAAAGHEVDLDTVRSDIGAVIAYRRRFPDVDSGSVKAEAGAVIDHHYKLCRLLNKTQDTELWKARHIQGRYDSALSIYRNVDAQWFKLSNLFRSLSNLYHPHTERVIAFGQLGDSQDIYIARAWIPGCSLDEVEQVEEGQGARWFAQLLTGLQYLHSLDIFHGAICPKNIVINQVRAVLVNFGIGWDIAASNYAQQYADPNLWQLEGDAEKDLYGLVASFIDVLCEDGLAGQHSSEQLIALVDEFDDSKMDDHLKEVCRQVLSFEISVTPGQDYVKLFAMEDLLE
ncbi:NERD domain-containing protein kinase family protein [Motilimonas pumila]|uniref:Serine/threonine protein kinase n=1 Tax=Motilimonas pumila TaxID=2303987 RepID=A0A418YDH8_9GAMM|nr:NERD domain-containing protein kinase family protein [Motilimonas pumila]RJG42602.1 serine/threonine protein kinase [Motilimonas pumila]